MEKLSRGSWKNEADLDREFGRFSRKWQQAYREAGQGRKMG